MSKAENLTTITSCVPDAYLGSNVTTNIGTTIPQIWIETSIDRVEFGE